MSEKEFQLFERLLELVGSAGDGAFALAVVWLAQGYFTPILVFAGVVTVATLAYKLIRRSVDDNSFASHVRREAGVCDYGYVTRDEACAVIDAIRRGRKDVDDN